MVLSLLIAAAGAAHAGTITGTVSARGRDVPGGSAGKAYESKKFKFLEKVDYSQMRDFVVSVDAPYEERFASLATTKSIVVQENAMFSPHVMPILQGTVVEWPNEDDIFHNVFSFSEAKPFDLGLYKDEVKRVRFDQPGRVDVFCSIHKDMSCIILVMPNPWFALSDDEGRYEIRDVPAGTYKVKAWHERLPPQTVDVVVPADGVVEVDFELGIKGLPTY